MENKGVWFWVSSDGDRETNEEAGETEDLLNLHFTNISSVCPASAKPEKQTLNCKYKVTSPTTRS